ncbi:class I SAM-dependent methyltransferase [Sporosalibacterium faouarense]|uniref:class I SAM-dependent methyltransferase n=1 Tax=Sporosalibacterium faouarense TaxID=516123 RepID=UPI00311C8F83
MIKTNIKGIDLQFETSSDVFSPHNIDLGTLTMLSTLEFEQEDKVLDLGCGYGVVGVLAAKIIGAENVTMVDVSEEAVNLAKKNAKLNNVPEVKIYQSDGLLELQESNFTKILSNPPYHANFSVPKQFIEKGFNRLELSGRMYMVTKRKKWYMNKLISVFGGVKITEENGYYVFMAEKKSYKYANKKRRK